MDEQKVETKTEEKPKGEFIRGKELRVTERDYFRSLPLFPRIKAWIFGGVFGMVLEGQNQMTRTTQPRALVAYIPPIWTRIYFKYFYSKAVPAKVFKGVKPK